MLQLALHLGFAGGGMESVTGRVGDYIGLEWYWACHGPSWAGWEVVSGCGGDKAGLDGLGGHRCARLGRLAGLAGVVWAATG